MSSSNSDYGLRSRSWLLTINMNLFQDEKYTDDTQTQWIESCKKYNQIFKLSFDSADKYRWQWEVGHETQQLHAQVSLYYKNARQGKSIINKDVPPELRKNTTCFIRPWKAANKYCLKDDTMFWYGEQKNADEGIEEILIDPLKDITLLKWQREVYNIIKGPPDARTIHWICDPVGQRGKTVFAKHLCINHPNTIYVQGKASDIKCAVAKMVMEKKMMPKIIIFGITRSNENFVSYEAIESVKDGIFFSGKYESGMVMYNYPHVIVLANFGPDLNKLSMDRWNVTVLTDDDMRLDFDLEDNSGR